MKKRVVVSLGVALAVACANAFAQSQSPAAPAFEVASVKPSDPNAATGFMGSVPSMRPQGTGGIAVSNMPFRLLVRMAYGVQDFQLIGGPAWQSNKFDITAKAPEGTAKGTPDLLPMMKTLLADRFKLKTHTEKRELPVYALVLARSDGKLGPDIKPSSSDCSDPTATQKRTEELAKNGGANFIQMLAKGETIPCMIMPAINPSNPAGGFGLRGNGQAMAQLTQFLTQVTGR